MNADLLESEFAHRAFPYAGGLLLLEADVALELVERARRERIAVLGINCLSVTEEGVQEPLSEMSDYSDAVGRGDGCWSAAAGHIEVRRNSSCYFEVVLGRRLDPAV